MKVYTIKIIIAVLVLAAVFFSLWALEAPLEKPASAKTKTKWQRLLEKDGVNRTLWARYLPRITQKEYLKVKKYLLNAFQNNNSSGSAASAYALHQNISTTYFWVGEDGSADNHNISNAPSCWDENWLKHFGGVDDPGKRNGYFPAGFTPKENPFYFALPYNDFDSSGNRKSGLAAYVPWYEEKNWAGNESVCKNRWIKITKGDKIAYAQWQDSGPFGEDDVSYVFGTSQPKSKSNDRAGLDVSPAVRDYLGLSDIDKTSWQFVNAGDVPPGPWKNTITTSNISWN